MKRSVGLSFVIVVSLVGCDDGAAAECGGCLDEAGMCVEGNTDDTCGSGGLSCATCQVSAGSSCVEQTCQVPCGPANCAGCCDGDICRDGDADNSCGVGGAQCATCGSDTCSSGSCISTACADTCSGCCWGDTCVTGESDDLCGLGGQSCEDCGGGTCSDHTCVIDGASRWQLVLGAAHVNQTTTDGEPWDPMGGLPDPYARASVGGNNEMEMTGSTSSALNTYIPTWNVVVLSDVPARTLEDRFFLEIFDDDPLADDFMTSCSLAVDDWQFNGLVVEADCGVGYVVYYSLRPD